MTAGHATAALPRLAGLPGPARQLRRIAEDLEGGFSCVWVLPDGLVASGQARELLEELLYDMPEVLRVPSSGQLDAPADIPFGGASQVPQFDPDTVIIDDYDDGFGGVWAQVTVPSPSVSERIAGQPRRPTLLERVGKEIGQITDPLGALTSPEAGCQPVIVVCGWQEPDSSDTARLLRSLSVSVKSAGLPRPRRPRALAVVRLTDLPDAVVDSLDMETTVVHWWWGTLSRLDTATVTATARPRSRSPIGKAGHGSAAAACHRIAEALREEVITQISGPDLNLAVCLSRDWDGVLTSLVSVLSVLSGDLRRPFPEALGRTAPVAVERPPLELRDFWAAGAIDFWDGQLRGPLASWAITRDGRSTADLDAMIWQAQSRVLLPLIDGARAELAALLPSAAVHGPVRLAEGYGPRGSGQGLVAGSRAAAVESLAAMEVGDIWAAVRAGQVLLPAGEVNRLKYLRLARNKLAHRCALDDGLARDLGRALVRP
ncbi:hypothetical protein [Streptomyces sp. RKAG293]|uniref:hypothetical protein n=1 Tax=Streptomyces sp. RKAG293 TaxID=2893403 RepID=UPI002034115D|nr:hypothetical protein [Streptomyces sp. RKAG293]MCM2418612.1 hypothetical protein [Streptomyces sp. RKAG293]